MIKLFFPLVLLLSIQGCASSSGVIQPVKSQAIEDFDDRRVVGKLLDVLRDAAIDAHAQQLLSLEATQQIVKYHRDIRSMLLFAEQGHLGPVTWAGELTTRINNILISLPQNEHNLLVAYVRPLLLVVGNIQ